jgi:hypothetical protein
MIFVTPRFYTLWGKKVVFYLFALEHLQQNHFEFRVKRVAVDTLFHPTQCGGWCPKVLRRHVHKLTLLFNREGLKVNTITEELKGYVVKRHPGQIQPSTPCEF